MALTRTKNRTYILTPKNHPSRFVFELVEKYGLSLYMRTNEPEICDFMANRSDCLKDIHKCRACGKGYMIVRQNRKTGQYFFGCTNWDIKGIRCKTQNGWNKAVIKTAPFKEGKLVLY